MFYFFLSYHHHDLLSCCSTTPLPHKPPTHLLPSFPPYQFVWGPTLMASLIAIVNAIPAVSRYLMDNNMKPFGFVNSLTYTVFAIGLSYAFHAWTIMHAIDKTKIQSGKKYNIVPNAQAVRSSAAIITSLVYTVLPISPSSTTWLQFFAWDAVFAMYVQKIYGCLLELLFIEPSLNVHITTNFIIFHFVSPQLLGLSFLLGSSICA